MCLATLFARGARALPAALASAMVDRVQPALIWKERS
jgi:hypothetical protein